MASRVDIKGEASGRNAVAAPAATIADAEFDEGAGATDPTLVLPGRAGALSAGAGARVLMELFVGEVTGRLVVDLERSGGGRRGTLFFLHGEPVNAAAADADTALVRRLEERKALASGGKDKLAQVERLGAQLIQRIARLRVARPVPVLEALRDEVWELARAIVSASVGSWRFFDDVEFADCTPLTAVNPFGLVLEARRRSLPPHELLRLGEDIAHKTPAPLEGFANVAGRLRSFTGHVDLSLLVDGTMRADEIYRRTGLDPIMGGLVLGTLADTGLVELLEEPRAEAVVDKRHIPENALPLVVQADASLSQIAAMPERGANEILALYLDLKPERDDDAILGVDVEAPPAAIERGYQSRLAELDPRAIPMGRVRPYLLARAEELRSKVDRAYRRRTADMPRRAVDAYEIMERIGEGGMAEVFRARPADDPSQLVAVKRILPVHRADPEFARSFLQEARLARRVQHPNVVRVLTVGKSEHDLYLAMELVDGCDLGELVRRGKKLKMLVPIDVGCRIIADACGGLHAAHTAHDRDGRLTPILHRDVSPQNILVAADGTAKLTDFGIAKALNISQTGSLDAYQSKSDEDEEKKGFVKGKVAFLAPEVIDGKPASVRSDVYAMAMTAYAVLAKVPFVRGDLLKTMRAILSEDLVSLSSMRPEIPKELDAIMMRAAARNPSERHASAQELQLEIEEFLATRPAADVKGWAQNLGNGRAATTAPAPQITRTIPIDVDLDDL